jgi:hypothetical protein
MFPPIAHNNKTTCNHIKPPISTLQDEYINQIKSMINISSREEKLNYRTFLNALYDGLLKSHKGTYVIILLQILES